ncbi:MAG TPA: UDP-N-acetylmuramoyl-tripeptide--D-alanyl-D-alanine ligase [Candidatus Nanoarchaeia archaeon]|nr:UDP-N-acetylmuramoyl-tripeptide--D-alanyl-D-alanine ligase [Candidatus Nanoarchaeia archaeon]
MFKKIIIFKLKFLAKAILAKYRPKVVGITGSVGKTSAKEAVLCVLENKFRVRGSIKNYNNEFGLPLSIIGAESPGKNPLGWLAVFCKAGRLILFADRNYPEILILEMGVDKAGDMDYLNSIVRCDIGVITAIGEAHLESFGSLDKIQKEKGKILENLAKNGWAILNYDDEKTRELAVNRKNRILTYGFNERAQVIASNLRFKFEESKNLDSLLGITFKASFEGSMVPVVLPAVIGLSAAYAALAAIAVGVALQMNLVEIAAALQNFISPKGRMKLIAGIKHTLLIDDSYNASPQSSLAAIDFIGRIQTEKSFRKIAVFGDMLELGAFSEEGHRQVGQALARANFDLLITVGERSRGIGRGARDAGMSSESIFNFSHNHEAGLFLQDRLREGDLILIKGSQGARMEQVAKELMADPLLAGELLVRQGAEWIGR